jgi:hypothetical protein
MERINQTIIKRLHPKKGFTAPYIQFPWGYDRALIGKPVTIFKTDDGFFLSLSSNEFKPIKEKNNSKNDACFVKDKFKPKESLESRIINLENQISGQYGGIENSGDQTNIENQIVQNEPQIEEMSGRSKPPSVSAAFSSASYPDGYRAIHCPVLTCTRRGSPFHRFLFVDAQRVITRLCVHSTVLPSRSLHN